MKSRLLPSAVMYGFRNKCRLSVKISQQRIGKTIPGMKPWMENLIAKSYGGKKDYSNPAFKMTIVCATDCPLRTVVINANGSMTDAVPEGMLEIVNGHLMRGIRKMLARK